MKRLMAAAGAVLLCLAAAGTAAAAGVAGHEGVQAVVGSGHRGPVLSLDYDQGRGLLFSAGADGTVRIWDPRARILLKSIIVTNLRAAVVAVDPAAPQMAVLSTDGIHSYSLDVWDWETGTRLYQVPLDDVPLFIRYAASGRYILFALPRWKSLQIVNADNGTPITLQRDGEGIVGLARLSRSEKILMTYRLSGTLSFWDLASGRLVEEHQTTAQLSHLRVSHDLSFMVGSTDTEVMRIDLASGAVLARVPLAGVTSLDISPSDDEVACTTRDGAVFRWSFASGVVAAASDPLESPSGSSVVRYGGDVLYIGARDGTLLSLPRPGQAQAFPPDERAAVTGSAARGDMLALATADWVKVFVSGLPKAARSGADSSGTVRAIQRDNPFKAPAGVAFLDDATLLVFRNADGPGDYRILDIPSGSFRPAPPPLPAPIIEAEARPGLCLLLSQDGTLRIIDVPAGTTRVEMSRPGAMWATLVDGRAVVVGGDPGVGASASLVRINLETGETDPISSRNQYSYDVLYDAASATLYSLGVDADGTTNLLAHTGSDFQNESLVDKSGGEHLFASLALDPADDSLYTTLGREQVSQWKGGVLKRLAAPAIGATGLMSVPGTLYVLNRDSSVSLSASPNGDPLAQLSLFKDGGWALTMPGGRFAGSPSGQQLVNVLEDGKLVQNKESYLIPVRVAEGP